MFGMLKTFVLVITDLREAKVDCVTLGQYMQPTRLHLKVIVKAIAAISSFQSPFLCENYSVINDILGGS